MTRTVLLLAALLATLAAHGSADEPSRLERLDPVAAAIVRKLMQSK